MLFWKTLVLVNLLVSINAWSEIDKQILSLRSGMLSIDSSTTICNRHITTLMTMYELHQRKCCDPFQTHKKSILW